MQVKVDKEFLKKQRLQSSGNQESQNLWDPCAVREARRLGWVGPWRRESWAPAEEGAVRDEGAACWPVWWAG